jgi:hypothetical protein
VSRIAPVCLLILVAAVLTACGASADRAEVRSVAATFYDAVRSDRPDVACRQLSPDTLKQLESQTGQSCRGVITRLRYGDGGITAVSVYLTNAEVDLGGGETVFLSKGSSGWQLSALGCKPTEGDPKKVPMDCEVSA